MEEIARNFARGGDIASSFRRDMRSRDCSIPGGEGIRDDGCDGLVALCGSAWLLSIGDKESPLPSRTKGIRIVDDIEIYQVGRVDNFGSATMNRRPSQKGESRQEMNFYCAFGRNTVLFRDLSTSTWPSK